MKKYGEYLIIYILVLLGLFMITVTGERTITVLSEHTTPSSRHCLIIDPGHGGVDGGATSCSGVLESNLNLEISLRLNDLSHLLGFETVMIRTSDISIYTKGDTIAQKKVSDIKERVRIVNQTENGILLSIHQNYFPDAKYFGAQVFYTGNEESAALAKIMQDSFCATVNVGSNRKIKQSQGIYLMEHIAGTGVLIECGFLSNYQEEAKLRTEAYQKQLSCVIIASVSRFLAS